MHAGFCALWCLPYVLRDQARSTHCATARFSSIWVCHSTQSKVLIYMHADRRVGGCRVLVHCCSKGSPKRRCVCNQGLISVCIAACGLCCVVMFCLCFAWSDTLDPLRYCTGLQQLHLSFNSLQGMVPYTRIYMIVVVALLFIGSARVSPIRRRV